MFTLLKNNRGNSLIGALVIMVVLGTAAASVVNISSADSKNYTDNMQSGQSLAVGNAGIQWALSRLDNGYSPDVTEKTFGAGYFNVDSEPTASLVIVNSFVGEAHRTQSINADFAKNCVDLIVSQSTLDGATLSNILLSKECNNFAVPSALTLTWNAGECATAIDCSGSVAEDDTDNANEIEYEDVGEAPNGKFWICHVPPGNPENRHTLAVNVQGWINGHNGGSGTAHSMDYLGPCIVSDSTDTTDTTAEATVVTCTGTDGSEDSLDSCPDDDGGLHVTSVTISGTTVFQAGLIPSSETAAGSSGLEIDLEDVALEADTSHTVNITFDQNVPLGTWFTLRMEFTDGSELISVFRAGDQATASTDAGTSTSTSASTATTSVGYEVATDGTVVVEANYQAELEVVGSAITCGAGGAEVNVRVQLCIDGSCSQLWNYTDVDGGEIYTSSASSASRDFIVKANAYLDSCGSFSETYSSTNTAQVRTLQDGEAAPALEGFGGQQSVQQFLDPYLDANGYIDINSNQVIILFEFGTDVAADPNNVAADFQDLVLLMTTTQI